MSHKSFASSKITYHVRTIFHVYILLIHGLMMFRFWLCILFQTSFLQGLLGRNLRYVATLNKEQLSSFTINTVQVYGQEKYLMVRIYIRMVNVSDVNTFWWRQSWRGIQCPSVTLCCDLNSSFSSYPIQMKLGIQY